MIGQTAAPGSRISICRASFSVGAEMGSYICTDFDLFLNGMGSAEDVGCRVNIKSL
jgi:hypothetical protein